MEEAKTLRAAIVVVDMVEDTVGTQHNYPISVPARAIVPQINRVIGLARRSSWPVIFACDSFLPGDFIFEGKLEPHSLRGTSGAEVFRDLALRSGDLILPKRRFSAFFKTDLDLTLHRWNVDTTIICGISAQICVLATALDAISHDFRAFIVEDATASPHREVHRTVLDLYRHTPLYPLLRVIKSDWLETICEGDHGSAESSP